MNDLCLSNRMKIYIVYRSSIIRKFLFFFSLSIYFSLVVHVVGDGANRWIEKKRANKRRKKEKKTEFIKENKRKIRSFTTWIKNQNKLNRFKFDEKKSRKKMTKKNRTKPFLGTKENHVETIHKKNTVYVCVIVKCVPFARIPLRQKKNKNEEVFNNKDGKKIIIIKCAQRSINYSKIFVFLFTVRK